ncbi:uncharacterized protein VP01_252g6 [Puccinia sorghi]|uniref:Uncharacterized protein n=1 Tax=Puccinia sorghi TaxID=27349 RepID=A0A0L6V5I1_9BASI|nr:uncharacterized protein VP01_252g6 [Puccinia sorghi]
MKARIQTTDKLNPAAMWTFLCKHYKSKEVNNQSKVYQEFIGFPFRTDLKTFVDDLDSHLSNLSAGIIIAPTNAEIKESLFLESNISKLPNYQRRSAKQSLRQHWVINHGKNQGYHSCCTERWSQMYKQQNTKQRRPQSKVLTTGQFPLVTQAQDFVAQVELKSPMWIQITASWTVVLAITLEIANGSHLALAGDGFVNIKTEEGGTMQFNSLHVPKLAGSLISLCCLLKHGCKMTENNTQGFLFCQYEMKARILTESLLEKAGCIKSRSFLEISACQLQEVEWKDKYRNKVFEALVNIIGIFFSK